MISLNLGAGVRVLTLIVSVFYANIPSKLLLEHWVCNKLKVLFAKRFKIEHECMAEWVKLR
jgi:hypothetical protein